MSRGLSPASGEDRREQRQVHRGDRRRARGRSRRYHWRREDAAEVGGRNMRTIYWLFGISVALFISGIGFVIAGERTARAATPAAAGGPAGGTAPRAAPQQNMNRNTKTPAV